MNAFKLTGQTADGKTGTVWGCGKCLHVARDEEAARQCCDWRCPTCGVEVERYSHLCDSCRREEYARRDREMLEKAEKLDEWTGGVFWGERFYASLDEAVEDIDDRCEDGEDFRPEFLYVAQRCPPCKVELYRVLEDACSDMGGEDDEPESYLKGIPELEAAIERFNEANEDIEWYTEDSKRAVRVPPRDPIVTDR